MDQKKIGSFLKEMRKSKKISQEQLAEILGVSNRTVSRWETGWNMPDLDLLIEIAKFYEVDIGEILDGESKEVKMEKELEETVIKVAEYSNDEKIHFIKIIKRISLIGIITMIVYFTLLFIDPPQTPVIDFISGMMIGISFGSIIASAVFSSKYGAKFRKFKMRLLGR